MDQLDAIDALIASGKLDKACARIEAAILGDLNHPNILDAAVRLYAYVGRREQSLEVAKRLLHADPCNEKYRFLVAESLLALGRIEEAIPFSSGSRPPLSVHLKRILDYRENQPLLFDAWMRSLLRFPGDLAKPRGFQDVPISPFQYWSQGIPPFCLRRITVLWNRILVSLGLPRIHLFNKATARQWILAHAPEFLVPFDSSFHYAVEADVFRIAYASRRACLYIDCDNYPTVSSVASLGWAIAQRNTVLHFHNMRPRITNSFFVSWPKCPFFGALAAHVRELDFSSLPVTKQTVFERSGPGLFNRVLLDIVREGCASQDLEDPSLPSIMTDTCRLSFMNAEHSSFIKPPFELRYSQASDHWQACLEARGQAC